MGATMCNCYFPQPVLRPPHQRSMSPRRRFHTPRTEELLVLPEEEVPMVDSECTSAADGHQVARQASSMSVGGARRSPAVRLLYLHPLLPPDAAVHDAVDHCTEVHRPAARSANTVSPDARGNAPDIDTSPL